MFIFIIHIELIKWNVREFIKKDTLNYVKLIHSNVGSKVIQRKDHNLILAFYNIKIGKSIIIIQ